MTQPADRRLITEAALAVATIPAEVAPSGARVGRLMSPTNPLADSSRLHIRSHQKQEAQNQFNGGETAWFDVDSRAKSMLTWRLAMDPANPRKPYPLAGGTPPDSSYKRIVWAGAHWFAQDKPTADMDETTNIHGHWSVEVPDVDMSLRTRFQIFYNDRDDPTTVGTSNALISTSRADFMVVAGTGLDGKGYGRFVIQGGAAYNKFVEFNRNGNPSGVRWNIGANNAGESGTGQATGADFELRRYRDDGELLGTALAVRRLDGTIVLGDTAWEPPNDAARFSIHHSDPTASGFMVRPDVALTTGAAFKSRLTTVGQQFLASRVGTNGFARFAVLADGTHQWGPGTVAHDVGLARTAAGVLAVTDGAGAPLVTLQRQAAVANATDAATVISQLNSLLARLRTIGFIAP